MVSVAIPFFTTSSTVGLVSSWSRKSAEAGRAAVSRAAVSAAAIRMRVFTDSTSLSDVRLVFAGVVELYKMWAALLCETRISGTILKIICPCGGICP